MPILFIFAFLSGLITILAPCIWPLLPIVLSASSTGGHRKPFGVTLGIISSFGILTLSISYLIKIFPFDPNVLRIFAVIVIGFLGFVLVIPQLSKVLEGYVSRFSGRFNLGTQTKNGLVGGLITGGVLGIVWTPCAGPILATIATLSATQKVNSSIVLVTIFYVLGIGIPLFIFSLFGRKIFLDSKSLSPYLGRIQQIFGIIMIVTALLIFTNYDKIIEAKLLSFFPSYGNFITNFESQAHVQNELNKITDKSSTVVDENSLFNTNTPAPEFTGITNWINSKPLKISDLKGKVVLVDFWTYTCINCIRTLPHLTSWYEKYKDDGFIIVGVHTPEFEFEKNTSNVENALSQYKINYPVAQDNNYSTWNTFSNQYWPAEYLIDGNGNVRRVHFGEGEYDEMETAIQKLLTENGKSVKSTLDKMPDQTPTERNISPETYIGSKRMLYYYPGGSISNGKADLKLSENPSLNSFSLGGTWTVNDEFSQAGDNSMLTYNFYAEKVFLVLKPNGKTKTAKIYLDGKLINSNVSGTDIKNGILTIDKDKLYNLVNLKNGPEQHTLKIIFDSGVQVFAFTFG